MADRIFDLNMNKYGMNSTAIAQRDVVWARVNADDEPRRYMGANTGARVFKKVGVDM